MSWLIYHILYIYVSVCLNYLSINKNFADTYEICTLLQSMQVNTGEIREIRTTLESYIGKVAQRKRGLLDIGHPIKHGIITDWEAMEKVWRHLFYNEYKVPACCIPQLYSTGLHRWRSHAPFSGVVKTRWKQPRWQDPTDSLDI